jgi:HlyD family secretion protein
MATTPLLPAYEPFDAEEAPLAELGSSIRSKIRLSLIAAAVLLFGLGGAAAVAPIGGAVIGVGQVGVESRVKRVTHPVGGVISEILVRNGGKVRRGDVLMRLDATVSDVDADLSALTVDQMLAQRARLEAEQLGSASIRWPAQLLARNDADARQAIADQSRLFAIRRSEMAGMRAQLRSRMQQYQNQIAGYQAQIAALRKQQELIEPERQGVQDLWERDLVTINRRNQLERTAVDMEGSIASLEATIAQTQSRISEAREQLIQIGETRRSEAGTQLTQINAALNDQQVRRVSAGDVRDRSVIRAPYSGTIDKLAFTTVGEVVRPAETIMEIVPDGDELVVEAAVSPTDIDQVSSGQPARIRFSGFNMQTTPEIAGKVIFVAPERTTNPETQESYYAVRIEIADYRALEQANVELRPGMPAEVFIETGSRSLLSYITKPLRDQLARAFRDG